MNYFVFDLMCLQDKEEVQKESPSGLMDHVKTFNNFLDLNDKFLWLNLVDLLTNLLKFVIVAVCAKWFLHVF